MGRVKDNVEEGMKAGIVYEIKCGTSDKCYIGKTGRSVKTHVKEHFAHARNGNPQLSAPTKHVIDGHEEEWKAKIVEVADNKRVRRR